jgi:hypothetical protein
MMRKGRKAREAGSQADASLAGSDGYPKRLVQK